MDNIEEFLVSGGERGAIEYLKINAMTGKPYIARFTYNEFMEDAMSDPKVAEAMRLLTSGRIGMRTYIDALEEYAQYYYGDEVDHYRNDQENDYANS